MKNNVYYRSAALFLSLLTVGGVMMSCSDSTDSGNEETTTVPAVGTETAAVTEEVNPYALVEDSLPDDLDFDGRSFTIFVTASDVKIMPGEEGITGDVVDDAVVFRNMEVEDRLHVKLNHIIDPEANVSTITNILTKHLMSGDTTFDLYTGQQYGITAMLANGGFVNCYDLEHFDLSKPWWNERYMDELAIGYNTRYFLVSDYFLSVLMNTHVVFFNKTLYGQHYDNANQLYEWTLDGTWTLDKMAEAAKSLYVDVNNNGATDINDQLGYITYLPYSSVDPFIYLSDIEFTPRDSENQIVLNLVDERAVDLTRDVVEYFYQPGSYFNIANGEDYEGAFKEGRVLFLGINTLRRAADYRDMKQDFGLLPYPKYEESQENYNGLVADVATFGAVSSASQNLDMAGAVIEALSAESYRQVIPAYYDTALKVKYSRDDYSSQIIDLVRETSYTDFLYAYSASLNGIGVMMRTLVERNSSDYMSLVEKQTKAVNRALEKLVKAYEESQ